MRARALKLITALAAVAALAAVGGASADAASGPGTLYTAVGGGSYVISSSGVSPLQARLSGGGGVAVDAAGDIAVSDGSQYSFLGRNVIDLLPAASCSANCPLGLTNLHGGLIQAAIGLGSTPPPITGEPVASASVTDPLEVSFDAAGDLAATVEGSPIVSGSHPEVDLVANTSCSSDCPYGLSSMHRGYIYRVAGGGTAPYAAGAAATSVSLEGPYGVTFDARRDLIFSDSSISDVFVVAAHSCSSSCPFGLSSMTAGRIYAIAGNGTYGASAPAAAPGTSVALEQPEGVATDASGDVLFANSGAATIHLLAAHGCSGNCPYGLPSMTAGYLYRLSAFDGLSAPLSSLSVPSDVAVDPFGDLLVANTSASQVIMLANVSCSQDCPYGLRSMTVGDFYAIAGSGVYGTGASGGPAASTEIGAPGELSLGRRGQLYFVDGQSSPLVREVTGAAAELRLTVSGHGSIAGGGSSCAGNCTAVHAGGYRLALRALPARGWLLAGWVAGGCRGVFMCRATVEQGSTVRALFVPRSLLAHRLELTLARIAAHARPRAVRRHRGFTVNLTVPAAGRITITWHARVGHHRVLVGIGRTYAGTVVWHRRLTVRLTRAGRRLAAHAGSLRVFETATLQRTKHSRIIARDRARL